MTAHRHVQSMLAYAQDALETHAPWIRWEQRPAGSSDPFTTCWNHPLWALGSEYRRKPKTININGYDVPEPMRVAPAKGTIYYVPELHNNSFYAVWDNDETDREYLQKGICHFTKEAANLHSAALLSFTRIDTK